MISHVLDTDILSLFQRGDPAVVTHCASAPPGTLAVTVISIEEQFLGWYTRIRRAKKDDELARAYDGMTAFASFIKRLPILSFSAGPVRRFRGLRSSKIKIAKKDMSIAAIALERGAIVVTRNASDFGKIPGLQIEDWSK